MHAHVRRRKTARKRHRPRQIARASVVITDEKTSDPPDRMADRKGRRCGRERWQKRQALPSHDEERRSNTAKQAAKPAHAAAAEEKIAKWLLAHVLGHPQQLRANEAAEHTSHRRVAGGCRQAAARELAAKNPETHERADGDHDAEGRDFKTSDAKERWVHLCARYQQNSVNHCIAPVTAEVIISLRFACNRQN